MGQVLRYKTHESSNMAVAGRRTPFTNPRAQSAALHGKTRPDHKHARAMAEERVDRESVAAEIVARESFNEEGSVEYLFGNCPPYEPPSAGDAKDEAEEPRISHSNTEPSADKDSMCDREDDKDAEQEPEEIGDEIVRRSLPKGFTKGSGKTTTFLSRGGRTCCVLPMWPCVPHRRMCTTLGRFSRDGDFDCRRGLNIKEVQPRDALSIKFFKDRPLPCPKHVGATATTFVLRIQLEPLPTGCMDGCCYYNFKTSFKQGRKCRRRRGLGRSSKDLNRRSCPDYPARRGD
jgi:hypothetical protein